MPEPLVNTLFASVATAPTRAISLAEVESDGGEIRNGSDLPRIARATKILELARAYGIKVSDFDDESVHMPAPSDTYHY